VRAKNGQAISPRRRKPSAVKKLKLFIQQRLKKNDLDAWRRGRAVLGYIEGHRVVDLAAQAGVTRGSVNRWIQWYEAAGIPGLMTATAPGATPKLTEEQRLELGTLIDAGPQAAGYSSGVWTGPMIGDLIERQFGVRYHNHHVPRLLHELGFSLQRPRKRLARADAEKQTKWIREALPSIKKKRRPAEAW
jgi:transposase